MTEVPKDFMKAAVLYLKGIDISEIFSPERVIEEARRHGLVGGLDGFAYRMGFQESGG